MNVSFRMIFWLNYFVTQNKCVSGFVIFKCLLLNAHIFERDNIVIKLLLKRQSHLVVKVFQNRDLCDPVKFL